MIFLFTLFLFANTEIGDLPTGGEIPAEGNTPLQEISTEATQATQATQDVPRADAGIVQNNSQDTSRYDRLKQLKAEKKQKRAKKRAEKKQKHAKKKAKTQEKRKKIRAAKKKHRESHSANVNP